MAGEKGRAGGASLGATITDFDIMGSRPALGQFAHARDRRNIRQIHYSHDYNAECELWNLVASSMQSGSCGHRLLKPGAETELGPKLFARHDDVRRLDEEHAQISITAPDVAEDSATAGGKNCFGASPSQAPKSRPRSYARYSHQATNLIDRGCAPGDQTVSHTVKRLQVELDI
jgi:hypothetical protein